MAKNLYTGEVRTVGESMARSTTEAGVFKIFMDEPRRSAAGMGRRARWTSSSPRTRAA